MLTSEFFGKALFQDIMQRNVYNFNIGTRVQHGLGYANRWSTKSPREACIFVQTSNRKEMQTPILRHHLEDRDEVTFNMQVHGYF